MSVIELGIIVGSMLAVTAGFIYLAIGLGGAKHRQGDPRQDLLEGVENEMEHIFNDEFRGELRNRGRLHFEKIIGENAMFLQQDLQLTTSQLNDFMKKEITSKLTDEFAKYEQSIDDAKNLAVESINKTQATIELQRQTMSQQLAIEIANEKKRILLNFQENMGDIVNHYVLAAVSSQIDLNDQMGFILSELEANKKEIVADIENGA